MPQPYFPLFLDIHDNNCGIVGGGDVAAQCACVLLPFGARITVISPTLCPALQELEHTGHIRHIPRKFFRGDCSQMFLCVAATDDTAINIAVATECKAKSVPVYVANAPEYGTFRFPTVYRHKDTVISVAGDNAAQVAADIDALSALWATE